MVVLHTRPGGQSWSEVDQGTLLITAEHRLVADALAAALLGEGVQTRVTAKHPSLLAEPPDGPGGRGLLVTELDGDVSLRWARAILARSDTSWLVLTSAPRGPLWGALLDSGATHVMPTSIAFRELCDAIRDGVPETDEDDRARLVGQWRELAEERRDQLVRLRSLTPREMQVLQLLYGGQQVAEIAHDLGLAPNTVRSQVKAVRRKLGVGSQLAAVAVYGVVAHRRRPGGLRHVARQVSAPQAPPVASLVT